METDTILELPATRTEPPLNRGGRNPLSTVRGQLPPFGAVVSCYFPENESPNRPGIKARPCLVLGSERSAMGAYLRVAYGTTKRPADARAAEVDITEAGGLRTAGLRHPTRFVLDRTRVVPFIFAFFRANRGGSAMLGTLSPSDRARAARSLEPLRQTKSHRVRNYDHGR